MKVFFYRITFVGLSVCMAVQGFTQKRRAQILQSQLASGYGFIESLDGEVFEGKMKFNDNLGVVTVENGGESKTFTAKNTAGFRFDDTRLLRERVFYVLDFKNEGTGLTNPAFFEILGEFETFAVLAKIDPVETVPQKSILLPRPSNTMSSNSEAKVAFQKETIFIMNTKGELEPYLELSEKETEGIWLDTRSNHKKFLDRDLLEEYVGSFYIKLKEYAKANDLSFKVKEDLVRILAHYRDLLEN